MTDAAPFHNSEEMHYEPTQSSVCPLSVQSEYFGGVGEFILLLSTVELIIGDRKPEQEENLRLPFGSADWKKGEPCFWIQASQQPALQIYGQGIS